MPADPKTRTLRLAALLGQAATGQAPAELPDSATFTRWTQELLERLGCPETVTVLAPPRRSAFTEVADGLGRGDGALEKFFLRLQLKMAEATYRNLVVPPPPVDPELLRHFHELVGERAEVSTKFFQGLVDPQSSVRRALTIRQRLGAGLNSVLFIGDDDATSVALALVARDYQIRVIDIDERILAMVEKAAEALGTSIATESLDVRGGVPFHLSRRFEGVVTDPPKRHQGGLSFLRFAEGCLSDLNGSRVFWSEHPDWTLNSGELFEQLPRLGLRIEEVLPEQYFYPYPQEDLVDMDSWIANPVTTDEAYLTYLGIIDDVARYFGLDAHWFRAVTFWGYPWTHLYLLARSAAPA